MNYTRYAIVGPNTNRHKVAHTNTSKFRKTEDLDKHTDKTTAG